MNVIAMHDIVHMLPCHAYAETLELMYSDESTDEVGWSHAFIHSVVGSFLINLAAD